MQVSQFGDIANWMIPVSINKRRRTDFLCHIAFLYFLAMAQMKLWSVCLFFVSFQVFKMLLSCLAYGRNN